jgi:hypothetical protein
MVEGGHLFGATPLAPSHSNAATRTLTLTTSQKIKQIASAKCVWRSNRRRTMPHRSRCKYAANDMLTTDANNEWRGERQGSLGQMRLHLVQSWGCQGLQAMEPTTEPAMTPGFAADAASGTGLFVVGGGDGRGAGAASESSTT